MILIPPYYAYTQRAALDAAAVVSSVVLLVINDNAGDATTTFDDEATANHTMTANGNVQYDTAFAPTGMTSSALFDGTGDFLTTTGADLAIGTQDFCLELMVRDTDTANINAAIRFGTGALDPYLYVNSSAILNFFVNGADKITGGTLTGSTWYHVALDRTGTSTKMWLGGVQAGTTYTDSNNYTASGGISIGRNPAFGGHDWNGHICCVRLTIGASRYQTTFTPPTLPLSTS